MPLDWNTIVNAQRRNPELSNEGVEALRGAASYVLPTSPEEAALALILGPFGRGAKVAGSTLLGAGFSPDAEAASGGLSRLAGLVSPHLDNIYTQSVAFGKEFPRSSDDGEGDAARHAYASSRVAREYGPGMAKALGWLNEALSIGSDRRTVRMDEFNNAAGIPLGELDDEAARQRIREMLDRKELKVLPTGFRSNYAKGGLAQMPMMDGKRGSCGKLCATCEKRHNCNKSCGG